MAAIVYDGLGDGGTLFEGKTFWIAQRVPSRPRWVEAVQANGGTVVLLEKNADIMIADHARKHAPPGSYSWTYIQDSIKNGYLEELENHPAGSALGTLRPVGSSQASRGSRTPFTPEDDRILAQWVVAAERKGISTKGNKLYEDLELANPRHTFQSWRDRWVKYVSHRPRPEVIADHDVQSPVIQSSSSNGAKSATNSTPKAVPPHQQTMPKSSQMPSHPSQPRQPPQLHHPRQHRQPRQPKSQPSRPPQPMQGNRFTPKDAHLLFDIYDDLINIDEARVIDAWQTWAEHQPQHTAQEWLAFWVNDIKPQGPMKAARESSKSSNEDFRSDWDHGSSTKQHTTQRPEDSLPQTRSTKELRFAESLKEFAEEQQIEIDFEPLICGRKVPLYVLWELVNKPGLGGFDNVEATGRWMQVATSLNFNTFRNATAPLEIRHVYEEMLVDFDDSLQEYKRMLSEVVAVGGELTETQMLDQQLHDPESPATGSEAPMEQRAEEVEYDDDLDIPNVPPQRLGASLKKHSYPVERNGSEKEFEAYPMPSANKRPRMDKGKGKELEIPSTPDQVFSTVLKIDQDRQQSASMHQTPRQADLVSAESVVNGEDDEDAELPAKLLQRDVFIGVRPLSTQAATRHSETDQQQERRAALAEPETQDFHFSRSSRDEESNETPSKQLHQEEVTAIEDVTTGPTSMEEDISTQSQTDSQRTVIEIQLFIDHHVSLGYPEEIVIEALQSTTMETGDAAVVMEELFAGGGVPNNIEGVWTEEDDSSMIAGIDYARLQEKHGEHRCAKRKQYLEDRQEVMKMV